MTKNKIIEFILECDNIIAKHNVQLELQWDDPNLKDDSDDYHDGVIDSLNWVSKRLERYI